MTDEQPRAVFVDPSGRRGRIVSRICWALGSLGTGYVALVLVALVVPAGSVPLTLPGLGPVVTGPGAPALRNIEGTKQTVSQLLRPSPSPSSSPRSTSEPAPRTTTTMSPALRISPKANPASPAGPTAQPTPASTNAATPGPPETRPTPRSTKAAASPKPRPTRSPRG